MYSLISDRHIFSKCSLLFFLFLFTGLQTSRTFPVMGNSVSTSFITPTPKKLSWGRQKEDTIKLDDLLTQYEDDLWGVKRKQTSVKKIHLTRSLRYINLAAQESDSFQPKRGEMVNPAFVGDQGP